MTWNSPFFKPLLIGVASFHDPLVAIFSINSTYLKISLHLIPAHMERNSRAHHWLVDTSKLASNIMCVHENLFSMHQTIQHEARPSLSGAHPEPSKQL